MSILTLSFITPLIILAAHRRKGLKDLDRGTLARTGVLHTCAQSSI